MTRKILLLLCLTLLLTGAKCVRYQIPAPDCSPVPCTDYGEEMQFPADLPMVIRDYFSDWTGGKRADYKWE